MSKQLPEAAQERDLHRATILGLAGFSFTAVAALSVLDATAKPGYQLTIWYVLVSFIALSSALNLQGTKSSRWQNQLATALIEMGVLALLLSLVSLICSARLDTWFKFLAGFTALAPWAIDHLSKLKLDARYFRLLDQVNHSDEAAAEARRHA